MLLLKSKAMRILITGANGFIGQNLRLRLSENKHYSITTFDKTNSSLELDSLVANCDFIFQRNLFE